MPRPFYRSTIDPVWLYCKYKFKKEHNINDIISKSVSHVNKCVGQYPLRWQRTLKFYILRKWFLKNLEFSFGFVGKLNSKIEGFGLKQYLLPAERDYIFHMEEISFAHQRTIKILDTPFQLLKGEKCNFKIINVAYIQNNEGKLREPITGILYITNVRLVLFHTEKIIEVYLNDVHMSVKKKLITFKNKKNKYLLKTDDTELFKIYMNRMD